MIVKNAEFIKSVSNFGNILDLSCPEFAFVGRSNCGKSSLINMITGNKKLAKTSQTPGHTKLLNYFYVNKKQANQFVLVDLPGYGFSKAGKNYNQIWNELIEKYLLNSKNLKRIFVLIDCRHEPSQLDKMMIEFLYYNQIPFTVVLTKTDKLSKSKLNNNIDMICSSLKLGRGNVLKSSSETSFGKQEILSVIENDLTCN